MPCLMGTLSLRVAGAATLWNGFEGLRGPLHVFCRLRTRDEAWIRLSSHLYF